MAWLATPPALRVPRSQRALAEQLERDPATLSIWKRFPGFGQGVTDLALAEVRADLAPILFAVAREAKKGSLEHAKWLFEVTGFWTPRQRHEHQAEGREPVRVVITTVPDRERPSNLAGDRPDPRTNGAAAPPT
jgi:hypothetical protein